MHTLVKQCCFTQFRRAASGRTIAFAGHDGVLRIVEKRKLFFLTSVWLAICETELRSRLVVKKLAVAAAIERNSCSELLNPLSAMFLLASQLTTAIMPQVICAKRWPSFFFVRDLTLLPQCDRGPWYDSQLPQSSLMLRRIQSDLNDYGTIKVLETGFAVEWSTARGGL